MAVRRSKSIAAVIRRQLRTGTSAEASEAQRYATRTTSASVFRLPVTSFSVEGKMQSNKVPIGRRCQFFFFATGQDADGAFDPAHF